MGAMSFMASAKGATAKEAFIAAREEAAYEHGHGGYSGTIAEKGRFVQIAVPTGQTAADFAEELMEGDDPRIADKWGPAGCVEVGKGSWLFFGYASS